MNPTPEEKIIRLIANFEAKTTALTLAVNRCNRGFATPAKRQEQAAQSLFAEFTGRKASPDELRTMLND